LKSVDDYCGRFDEQLSLTSMGALLAVQELVRTRQAFD